MNYNSTKILIEDSLGNTYYFTYKDFSIYCKEVTCYGDIKESLLVNQVNEDFIATIILDDIIYLVCYSKNKGILLFTYSEKSWKMSEILYSQSDINLLDIFIAEGSTHILYATKLPLANYYNVYHLYNRNGHWKKNDISEIFSENICLSFSSAITDNNYIHFVNVWHDGKKHILNNNTYNSTSDKWSSKKFAALVNSNITVELIADSNRLHLLFHTIEDDVSILFYFIKKSSDNDEFNFIALNKMVIGAPDYMPLFNADESGIYMEWISDNKYYKHIFDMGLREWRPQIEFPLVKDSSPDLIILVKNERNKITKNKIYCIVDNELNIQKPYKDSEDNKENEPAEFNINYLEDEVKKNNKIDELVPYLIDQIKNLSDDIKNINTKLNLTDHDDSISKISQKDSSKKTQSTNKYDYKKSKFKDNFINNKITPTSLNVRSTTSPQITLSMDTKHAKNAGNFKDSFLNSNMSGTSNYSAGATYHGTTNNNKKAYKSPDSIHSGKLDYVNLNALPKEDNSGTVPTEVSSPDPDLKDLGEKSDGTNLLKKISEFLKQNF